MMTTYKCLLILGALTVAANAASIHVKLFKSPSRVHERFVLKLVSPKQANDKNQQRYGLVESSQDKLSKIHSIIRNGISDLKKDADYFSQKNKVKNVADARWKDLNATIEKRIDILKNTISKKDSTETDSIWDLFLFDFQITFGAFVQNVTQDVQSESGDKDSQQPILVIFMQAGFGSLVQELQEALNPTKEESENITVISEPDVPVQMPKTVLTLISSFISGQSGSAQNDAPTSQRPIQALAESIGQAVSNLNPFRHPSSSTTTSTPATTHSSPVPEETSSVQTDENDVPSHPINREHTSPAPSSNEKEETAALDDIDMDDKVAAASNPHSSNPLNVVIHVVYDKPSLDALTTHPTSAVGEKTAQPRKPIAEDKAVEQQNNPQVLVDPLSSQKTQSSVAEIENKQIAQGETFNIIIDLSSVTASLANSNANGADRNLQQQNLPTRNAEEPSQSKNTAESDLPNIQQLAPKNEILAQNSATPSEASLPSTLPLKVAETLSSSTPFVVSNAEELSSTAATALPSSQKPTIVTTLSTPSSTAEDNQSSSSFSTSSFINAEENKAKVIVTSTLPPSPPPPPSTTSQPTPIIAEAQTSTVLQTPENDPIAEFPAFFVPLQDAQVPIVQETDEKKEVQNQQKEIGEKKEEQKEDVNKEQNQQQNEQKNEQEKEEQAPLSDDQPQENGADENAPNSSDAPIIPTVPTSQSVASSTPEIAPTPNELVSNVPNCQYANFDRQPEPSLKSKKVTHNAGHSIKKLDNKASFR